ncbi:MAG: histidine triad nucleotide-binding protein [Chloroflexota bacterium]
MECIFCKILSGQAPANFLYRDEQLAAFRDIHPAAPVHVLIVPTEHIASVNDLEAGHEALVGRMFSLAKQLARQEGIDQSGYRLVVNTGPHSGQAVFHIHLHLLGGARLRFP